MFFNVGSQWRASRAGWQWQPTLTVHDPQPPLTLENPAVVPPASTVKQLAALGAGA